MFASNRALVYGTTFAPDGAPLDGIRLRFLSGESDYAYANEFGGGHAVKPFAEALVGYQRQVGPVTLKMFVGATGTIDLRAPADVLSWWTRKELGLKAAVEAWWTINADWWASFDSSLGSRDAAYWTRGRVGYRLLSDLSLGLEAGLAGAVGAHETSPRLGAFARWETAWGELACSGGIAYPQDSLRDSTDSEAKYATLQVLRRF